MRAMKPKGSKLNFNYFIQWFGLFKHSDICLLQRRAACILQQNRDGVDLLILCFKRDGKEIEFGATLVQVKNCLKAIDAKDTGRKLFVTSVFKHSGEEYQNIPLF
jgi:hypothetical protein